MHLTPHWIPLVASLGLLAGGSFASAAEEAFDLWNECAKACVLDLKDGVRSSRMSVDPAIADTNGQGVLHYSMVLEGGNDALKLAIDNALSITSDGLTILPTRRRRKLRAMAPPRPRTHTTQPARVAQAIPSIAAGSTPQPQPSVARLTAEAARASTEPTERSMPPTIRMKVMPTASTTRSGIWLAMARKVP